MLGLQHLTQSRPGTPPILACITFLLNFYFVFYPLLNPTPANTSPALPVGCHLSLTGPPLAPLPVISTRRNESPRRKVHSSAQGPMALTLRAAGRQSRRELVPSLWLSR